MKIVNLLSICEGIGIGWAMPNITLLTSDKTPAKFGRITFEEVSWITSLLCIGGLIGNIIYGYAGNKFGRKKPLLFLVIPIIVSKLFLIMKKIV